MCIPLIKILTYAQKICMENFIAELFELDEVGNLNFCQQGQKKKAQYVYIPSNA